MRTRAPWSIPATPFTAAQVAPLGVTEGRLRAALKAGALLRLRHGVWVAASAIPDDAVALHLLRAQAEQVIEPAAVASHETAALALGLPLPRTDHSAAGPVHLTRPRSAHGRSERRPDRHVHLADLPRHHRVSLPSGLVVTSRERTALDVAAGLEMPEGLMIVDAAARAELVGLAGSADRRHTANERLRRAAVIPLESALDYLLPAPRRRLRALVDRVDVRRESPMESLSFGHMVLAGLPLPSLQVPIRTNGRTYYTDFLWEDVRVIGEADGKVKYADSSAIVAEKVREGELRDVGYEVVRWTGTELSSRPQVVTARIGRALAARGLTV